MTLSDVTIKPSAENDVPVILSFIKKLSVYEKLEHEVIATEEILRESLFGQRRVAEVILGSIVQEPVSFALFFHNFSTFLGRPGIYLEDLFVDEDHRGKGFGLAMLAYLARLAKERNCGRLEFSVLNWNEPAIGFYKDLGAILMDEWTTFRFVGEPLDQLTNR